jgi:hypothetical protein
MVCALQECRHSDSDDYTLSPTITRRNIQEIQGLATNIRTLEDNSIIVDFVDKTPLFTIKILLTVLSIGVFALALAVIYLLYLRSQDFKNAQEDQESNGGPLGISALNTSDMEWLEHELGSSMSSRSSSLSSLTKSAKLYKLVEEGNARTPDTSRLSEYGADENLFTVERQRTNTYLQCVFRKNNDQIVEPVQCDALKSRVNNEFSHSSHQISNAESIVEIQDNVSLNISNRNEPLSQTFTLEQEKNLSDLESPRMASHCEDETARSIGSKKDETETEGYSRLQEI